MFELRKKFTFEAAHCLPFHDGKCARLHGHSFVMEVELCGNTLHTEGAKQGMVFDFYDISQAVKPLLEQKLDHYYLNESTGLINPTSEELSAWIFKQLVLKLPGLRAVTVFETCTSSCRYTIF